MSQTIRLSTRPANGLLPQLTGHFPATFQNSHYWAALLPKGSRVYRYGASEPQLTSSRQPWVNVTEGKFLYSEDAIRFCSLLDVTMADHGERDPKTGSALPGVGALQSWNTAALRGELEALDDLYLWAGVTAPMAFDRKQGGQVTGGAGQTVHVVTPGGASQLLVQTTNMAKFRLVGSAVVLPRTPVLH